MGSTGATRNTYTGRFPNYFAQQQAQQQDQGTGQDNTTGNGNFDPKNINLDSFRALDNNGIQQFNDYTNPYNSSQFDRDHPEINTLNRYSDFQRTVVALGLHNKPMVLENSQWDALAKTQALDGVYLWRGVTSGNGLSAQDVINQTKFGDNFFAGDGIHGDGIYLTTKFGYANQYAGGNSNGLMKGFINKSLANPITERRLLSMQRAESSRALRNMDQSSYALYKGYNVVHCPGGNGRTTYKQGGQDFYVVLDRKILVLRDTTR